MRAHKAQIYRLARRYAGDSDDAYDLTQETFISAWRAIGRFDPDRSFATWIKAIAINKCRDFSRRASTRRFFLRAFAAEPVQPSAPEFQDRGDRLDLAIAKLPPKYKEPLLLTTVGGLSHQEAAWALHLSPKAVEMRLHRARKRLSEFIGEGGGEG